MYGNLVKRLARKHGSPKTGTCNPAPLNLKPKTVKTNFRQFAQFNIRAVNRDLHNAHAALMSAINRLQDHADKMTGYDRLATEDRSPARFWELQNEVDKLIEHIEAVQEEMDNRLGTDGIAAAMRELKGSAV